MSNELVNKIKELILPYLANQQIHLYDCELLQEGKETVLRVLIERADGSMDLSTCVEISRGIGQILDDNDPFDQEYMLEVASPGAERPLLSKEDYQRAVGKYVALELKNEIKGVKSFIGNLLKIENEEIHLQYFVKGAKKKLVIGLSEVVKANLAVKI